MKHLLLALFLLMGCAQETSSAPIKLEPAPETAPKPAAQPAPSPPAPVLEPPKSPEPAPIEEEIHEPVLKLRGQDGFARAKSSRGKVVVSFTVDDPCTEAWPKVAIDAAARTLRITHKLRDPNTRCIPEPTDYRTTISGLPAGRFELSAPGLAAAFIDVPEAAEKIEPRARSVVIGSGDRAGDDALGAF